MKFCSSFMETQDKNIIILKIVTTWMLVANLPNSRSILWCFCNPSFSLKTEWRSNSSVKRGIQQIKKKWVYNQPINNKRNYCWCMIRATINNSTTLNQIQLGQWKIDAPQHEANFYFISNLDDVQFDAWSMDKF